MTRTYLALPANDATDASEGTTQFLMLLELTPDTLEQLQYNLTASHALQNHKNIGSLRFNFQGNITILGEDHHGIRPAIENLEATAGLRVLEGNLDALLVDHERYMILAFNAEPETTHPTPYNNEMHVFPQGSPAFGFNGELNTYDIDNWHTPVDLYASDLKEIRELYAQHA